MATASMSSKGGPRSSGISYQDLLDRDSRPVPPVLRTESPPELGVTHVPRARYVSREFHDLEMEKVWRRVWQMACREEQIPEVGDHSIYEIGDHSILVVRSAEDRIQAFHNVCLHRGRLLREHAGRVSQLRCPFHGWTWKLDGSLAELPCRWDFPHVDREAYHLPELKVGTWGGFVFVNMDPDCEAFEDYIGVLPEHFERWPLEDRYLEAHVAKKLPCNWKVAQEAFMEAYHVVATHPQLMASLGDSNSQYDVWGNVSRAMTASGIPSPHLRDVSEQSVLESMIGASSDTPSFMQVPPGMTARQLIAQTSRVSLAATVPGAYDLTDAELIDSIYYTLFPNFHPWGGYSKVNYRFRPNGNDPNRCIMEVFFLAPFRGKRPAAAKTQWLEEDDDWTEAVELGPLSKVFNQDTFNMGRIQAGLRAKPDGQVPFAMYQEAKIRHFHELLARFIGDDEAR
jgi:phenylpropionate dioxygenase-like ring-hydroxylating dioxygenase large terminal subunit